MGGKSSFFSSLKRIDSKRNADDDDQTKHMNKHHQKFISRNANEKTKLKSVSSGINKSEKNILENSPTIMKRVSAERPASASSIRGGTRQRLQHPSSRRVHVTGNTRLISYVDQKRNSSLISTVALVESKSIANDTRDRSNISEDIPSTTPLKRLTFKKIPSNPIEVRIRCIFLRVGEIDTLNERYYAELLLQASWEEASLKGSQTQAFDPAVHWIPELELLNGIGELQDDITYSVRYDKQGLATVTEHHQLKGILWERMELQHFPFDVQELSLSLTTSRTASEMKFLVNLKKPSGVNRRVFTDEQEWYLFEHVDIEITEQMDEYLDDGHNHPVVTCSCHTARKFGYFIWNAYFLIFLITSASFTTFPIPLSNIHGRVQIACTLLLTSITFRWLCNKSLPEISYLTAVDVYAIGSIFSLCLLNIYHGVIGYINYYQSSSTTGILTSVPYLVVIDRWALVVFTILFFAYQIGTIIWIYVVPWRKRRMMFKKDDHTRLHIASNFIEGL